MISGVCVVSHVQLFATPCTIGQQAPLSTGFFRQECWSGLLLPPPGDFPDPGIKPSSLSSPALAGGFFTTGSPGKPHTSYRVFNLQVWNPILHCIRPRGPIFTAKQVQIMLMTMGSTGYITYVTRRKLLAGIKITTAH